MNQQTPRQSATGETTPTRHRTEGQREPPADASATTVVPFKTREVPAGDWIVHGLSYDQEEDEQEAAAVRRDLEQFLDRVDSTVRIDGEPVEAPDQYWSEPEEVEPGRWSVEWQFATPPQPVGTEHTFELTWTFDPPFEPFDGEEQFDRIETPGCTYQIVDSE